jgi:hypothetical protein
MASKTSLRGRGVCNVNERMLFNFSSKEGERGGVILRKEEKLSSGGGGIKRSRSSFFLKFNSGS